MGGGARPRAHTAARARTHHTAVLGEMSRFSSSPTARAMRYAGIGTGWLNSNVRVAPVPVASPCASALMTATRSAGTVTVALYVLFTDGVSWHGTIVRAWMACKCARV